MRYLKKDLKGLFNIGDSLCTPDVYFDISSEKDLRIIGGGVWNIRKYGTDQNAKDTILWSAGESHKDRRQNFMDSTPLNYLEWSSRDKDFLKDKTKFVPCVSCFNKEILKEPTQSKRLIFTNANNAVSARIDIKERDDLLIMQNDVPYDVFIEKWKQCDTVITNSYHGIYWSLLSGRSVSPFGYSSKFTSVMNLFRFELPESQRYDIRGRYSLNDMVGRKNKIFFNAPHYKALVDEFKNLNLDFAKKLEKHGVTCNIKQ